MKIEQNYNLSKLNTFGVDVKAKLFTEISTEDNLGELFLSPQFKENKKVFLGGGSNVLFLDDFGGIVILNRLKGIEIIEEKDDRVLVRAMGGEWWDDLVNFTVSQGYWGMENLSMIPGTVGAAPVQNIGAYGVEIKDILYRVEAFSIESGEKRIFNKEECHFGYRESVFKNELKGKYFISAVVFELSKKENKNVLYKNLKEYIEKNNIEIKNPKDVSKVVRDIRQNKLPDTRVFGNAGSFFKNLFITEAEFLSLKEKYPDIPSFVEGSVIKVPAGWLIEKSGPRGGVSWKGYRVGNVGVHHKQALVLVNFGGASGKEIMALAEDIIKSVKDKFGLVLSPEVNVL
jgi:UDP-N-acetylmuramate dehydrogenase